MIKKISDEKREQIANASAKTLPNNPTGRGMTADEIRKRLWEPITASEKSLADEINRIVGEANADIEAAINKAENELSTEKNARETSEEGIRDAISAVSGELEEHKAEVSVEADKNTIPRRTAFKTLEAETKRISTIQYPEERQKKQLVNLGFFDAEMDAHKADVEKTFNTLEAQIAGKTRSYVVGDAEALEALLSGRWEVGTAVYSTDGLRTGDNIFVVESGIPDFWFEATTDTSRAESLTLTVGGTERTLTLLVYGYDNGGFPVGILHVIEGEKTKIDFSEIEGRLGDVDAALDAILALQAELIGGEDA